MSITCSTTNVFAEMNIKDCLESEEDCLELEDTDDENRSLILENEDESSSGKTGSMLINVLKIIFALALVLLLIYLLLTLLKKKNKLSTHSQALENLGGISVGQQKSIQIIRIGEKVYAIGIGNDVTMLDEVTDEDVILQLEENAQVKGPDFSFIQNLLTKRKATDANTAQSRPAQPFSSNLDSELEKLKSQREQLIEMNKRDDDNHG